MNKPEYRIKEFRGEFTIQRKYEVINVIGHLWWAKVKTEQVWYPVDFDGKRAYQNKFGCSFPMPPFSSIDAAREQIKMIINHEEPIYPEP